MKRRLMICILLSAIFAVSMVGASEWCYQEFANVSTPCGGLDTGSYSLQDFSGNYDSSLEVVIDGDKATCASAPGPPKFIYVNYTKPLLSSEFSLLEVTTDTGSFNFSPTSNCWNQNPLQWKLQVHSVGNNLWCWDGVDWYIFNPIDFGVQMCEEAIWWNIEVPPNIIMRYDDGNDTAIVPQNMIERFDDGTIEISVPKNIFRRFYRWIRSLA